MPGPNSDPRGKSGGAVVSGKTRMKRQGIKSGQGLYRDDQGRSAGVTGFDGRHLDHRTNYLTDSRKLEDIVTPSEQLLNDAANDTGGPIEIKVA